MGRARRTGRPTRRLIPGRLSILLSCGFLVPGRFRGATGPAFPLPQSARSIEPLVGRVKLWIHDDQKLHLADRTMPHARPDQDRLTRRHGNSFPIEL